MGSRRAALVIALPSLLLGCSGARTAAPVAGAQAVASSAPDPADPSAEHYAWREAIGSPDAAADPDPLVARCGHPDAALGRVAARLAERQARGLPDLDMPEIAFALRAEGSPYVWTRFWSVQGGGLGDDEAGRRMAQWLTGFHDGGERRCGIGRATAADQGLVLVALATDVLADLAPVPTRARLGQWLRVRAQLLVALRGAEVVVLGPRGAPRTVPTSVQGREVRANFAVDHAGPWLVQVLAEVEGGPRPVAEALVQVDVDPPTTFRSTPAPGEDQAEADGDPSASLVRMVNGARASERLSSLRRDRRLDAIAEAHARAMGEAHRIGHDVGDGSPEARIEAAGLSVLAAGENVVRARDVRRAHRALWASPAHRAALLHPDFDSVGVGVVQDESGDVWACELLADFR